jgi:hypothetical protein
MVPQARLVMTDTVQDQIPARLDHLSDRVFVHNSIDFSHLTVRIV